MFGERVKPKFERQLESELEKAMSSLALEEIHHEDYAKKLGIVERLHKMTDKSRPSTVSKDTMLMVGANLLGIAIIVGHEQLGNVLTSKAIGFVFRMPKV